MWERNVAKDFNVVTEVKDILQGAALMKAGYAAGFRQCKIVILQHAEDKVPQNKTYLAHNYNLLIVMHKIATRSGQKDPVCVPGVHLIFRDKEPMQTAHVIPSIGKKVCWVLVLSRGGGAVGRMVIPQATVIRYGKNVPISTAQNSAPMALWILEHFLPLGTSFCHMGGGSGIFEMVAQLALESPPEVCPAFGRTRC